MHENDSDLTDKILQQYETVPFPNFPLDQSPKDSLTKLYLHNFATFSYFRARKVTCDRPIQILDVACGTGYTTLTLAEANPNAQIIGIDISEKSLEVARQRLEYHGFSEAKFFPLSFDRLEDLGMKFDYINADDILYFLPDLPQSLTQLRSILKPQGIIQANVHSRHQRANYYRAQELFKFMGLMDGDLGEDELDLVRSLFHSLKDGVKLKQQTWHPGMEDPERIMMNYLLRGDRGFTCSDVFDALDSAQLSLIRMVNWWQWEMGDLFEDTDNLPAVLALGLSSLNVRQRLCFYEWIHPVHRLLDFWCCHTEDFAEQQDEPETWAAQRWQSATVYLHPQLQTESVAEALRSQSYGDLFSFSHFLPITQQPVVLNGAIAACLFLPLLRGSQTIPNLVERWRTIFPVDLGTLQPISEAEAQAQVRQVLIEQERLGFIMIEE